MHTITIEQLLIIHVREISVVIRGSVALTPVTHAQYIHIVHACDTLIVYMLLTCLLVRFALFATND